MNVRARISAVVVAHPDDEALWLSSAITRAQRIVFGFGAVPGKPLVSEARRKAVAELPLNGIVHLEIPESGVEWQRYQSQPQLTAAGVRILEELVRERYDINHHKLLEGLRTNLAGCQDVYTHNPWGEYGHAEHVQVYRAVTALQEEFGYTVWFSNYVSEANWRFVQGLAESLRWSARVEVRPDKVTAHVLRDIYRRNGAWTWKRGYRWPVQEVMYAQPPGSHPGIRHRMSGERLLVVDKLRVWNPPWRNPSRRLHPPGQSLKASR